MKKTALSLCLLLGAALLQAQTDQVLMTIDDKPVMASEFMYIYQKNNKEATIDPKSMDDYLTLFENFKLKVAEAEAAGIDTTESFAKELKGYRAQAIQKYMQDEEAIDSLVKMSYHRMGHMRRAKHIAIACPQNATDSAEAAALALINELRDRATGNYVNAKGKKEPKADFELLAETYSSDPQAKETGGELGWVIPFRYVYSFEDAIYNTPVGEITPVFRSPFGYHIALVEEEEITSEVHAAHIMKMIKKGDDLSDEIAKKQIDSIYNELINGANFEETALALSDDKGTAMRGGDLGKFSKGMMVKEFEQQAFSMAAGTISQPFRTQYGWHIIKLYEKSEIQPLDSIYSQVLRNVQRDERAKEAEASFIRKTRAEYGLPDSMTDDEVRQYADDHLESKYEELRHLVQEYHDGILLFEISLQRVWDKASKDTAGLTAFFKANKKNYRWDEPRYKGYIVYAKDMQSAKRAKTIITTANPDSINSYIASRINNDSVKLVRVDHGIWRHGQNSAIDKYGFKDKKSTFTPTEQYPVVMTVKGKKLKAPEVYTDDRSRIVSDYQDMLEAQWIEELRQKHSIKTDYDVFNQLKAREAKQ